MSVVNWSMMYHYWDYHCCCNSLWLTDSMWRHRSESTLAQVMAYFLTTTPYYLSRFDLPSTRYPGIHSAVVFDWILTIAIPKLCFKFTKLQMCQSHIWNHNHIFQGGGGGWVNISITNQLSSRYSLSLFKIGAVIGLYSQIHQNISFVTQLIPTKNAYDV